MDTSLIDKPQVQPYSASGSELPASTREGMELQRLHADQEQVREKNEWTLKEKVLLGLLTVAGIGGLVWLGKKLILNKISDSEENKSFEEGTPATTAKKIKMAFENDGWPGTDTTSLRETLISVPSKEDWDKVVSSYQKLYSTPSKKANLNRDLSDELQTTELNEMMQIIDAKPQKKGGPVSQGQYKAWAKRLKAAFDKTYGFLPGTDSVSVTVTLNEIPTQRSFINVGVAYKTLFGTNLMDDLKSEGEFGQHAEWLKIIVSKPKS